MLRARHIPGRLNVWADMLSQRGQVQPTEWTLSPAVFRQLCTLWDRPHVDLFATRWNNRLPTFVSPIPDPLAWGVDALSMDWEGLYAYAYPPAILIPQVIAKVRAQQCRILLIAPLQPEKSWFPELLDLLVDVPRPLPLRGDLLRQPRSPVFHRTHASWPFTRGCCPAILPRKGIF